MFSIESYLTPYIAAYLGKYVDNFNKSNFQVSLWEGGATFQNVDLNLGAIEAELEIPFQVMSGHIHEMKISVPWTKITSEPIVVTLNTFELSLGLKQKKEGEEPQVNKSPIEPSLPPDTTGYMQGLMNRIIQNAKVVCRNMILKYVEEDIVISFNFENVTLCSVNSCWEQAFVDFGGTEFMVRRKLSCPDLTVCLDNVHSVTRHSYQEPLLYKCAFDVRILNQFQGPFSRTPYFRRIDILFNEADVSVSEQQIPMLMRLYNLLIALTQLKGPPTDPLKEKPIPDVLAQEEKKSEAGTQTEEERPPSSPPPETSLELCVQEEVSSPLYDWAAWAVGWIPFGGLAVSDEPPPEPSTPTPQIQPMLSLGLYVNAAHCTLKKSEQQPFSDKASTTSSTPSSRIKTKPYLKIHLQGIVADIVVQGPARSVRAGFCELRVHGVGQCPCGMDDGTDERANSPLPTTGIPYCALGRKQDDFLNATLFDPNFDPAYEAFDCRFHCHGYEDKYSEDDMLARTPVLALDSVEILPTFDPDECCTGEEGKDTSVLPTPVDSNFTIAFEKEGPKTSTRVVFAPISVRVSIGLIHRLKVIQKALEAYKYMPYVNILPLYIPELRFFMKIRMDRVELVFCDGESGLPNETNQEMRLTLFGIKANSGVKQFCRKQYLQLQSLDVQSYRKEGDLWVKGHCLGLVLSSTQGIDPEIEIAPGVTSSSTTSFEQILPFAPPPPKVKVIKLDCRTDRAYDSFLAISYTEAKAAHYLKTSLWSELPNSGSELLKRKLGANSKLQFSEEEDVNRLLCEVDLKVKSFDLFLHPTTLSPIVALIREVVSLFGQGQRQGNTASKVYTNVNVPMAYFSSERIRMFLQTATEPSDKFVGDVLLVQVPAIYLTPQVDKNLERKCVRPDLLGLEEEAGVTTLPKAFMEERMYDLYFPHVSLSTCNWQDLENVTLGITESLVAHPLFQQSELCISLSPALAYQQSVSSTPIIIAGYGVHMNLTKEIHITANTHQIALISRLVSDWLKILANWNAVNIYQVEATVPLDSTTGISNSGCPQTISEWEGSTKEVDSGVGAESTNTLHPPQSADLEHIPFDLFFASTNVRITVYHLEYAVDADPESESEDSAVRVVSFKPLLMLNLIRPYFTISHSPVAKKVNFSIFDLTLGMGEGITQPVTEFTLPKKTDFPVNVLETLPGERHPKTGLLRPLLIITTLDSFIQSVKLRCEMGRPVRVTLSMERFHHIAELLLHIAEQSGPSAVLDPPAEPPRELNVHRFIALVSTYTQGLQIYAKQIVVVIQEEPPGLTKAAITTSLTGLDLSLRGSDSSPSLLPADTARITISLETIAVTTLLGDRTDMLVNPFGVNLRMTMEWQPFLEVPLMAINLSPDPVRVFFGPQNILAILQVYHTFGYYWERFMEVEEKELVEILETTEPINAKDELSFDDDLRNGAFHFVYPASPAPIPPVYQAAICREERTITWRYPHPRTILGITTHPLPESKTAGRLTEVECSLSCWDEAQHTFVYVGPFVIHSCVGEEIIFSDVGENFDFVSSVWRVSVQSPMEEDDLQTLMHHDGIVNSLYVKSLFARRQVPKLVFVSRIPAVTIHLVNQRTYAGKIPEEKLGVYALEGLQGQMDQPFATIRFSAINANATMWIQRARAEIQTHIDVSVTDYAYLTDMTIVDRLMTRMTYSLLEENSRKVHQGFTFGNEKLCVKLGSSAMHTLMTATLCWIQVLKAYYGDVVDTSRAHFQPSVTMARIIIANDTAMNLNLRQVQTKKPLLVSSGSAYAFTWTTQKVKAELTLALPEEPSKETIPLAVKAGTLVRQLGDSHLFISTKNIHPAQILMRVAGSLDVGNGLDVAVEVGLLGRRMNQERCWTVESRSHGPSLLLPMKEVVGLRFRLTNLNGRQHGWSHSLTLEDFSSLPTQSKVITLYEERDGELVDLNIWCTLVEEGLDGGRRCLVLLLPLFRLESFLPSPTTATISEPGNTTRTSVILPGRGSQTEVDFRGQATAAHLLTFQTDVFSEASSPIPLIAGGGPCLETPSPKPPIESILNDLTEGGGEISKRRWPFTRENLDATDWLDGPRSDGPVKVSFKPWIPGFPSVIVQVKPAAMLVNLTGQTLLFRQEGDDLSIDNKSVFSPNDIHGKFAIGFNLTPLGGTGVVWSEELAMSDHPGPAQIHHINSDWKIPLNSFSRLELDEKNLQVHVTIEVTVYKGIILVILRPTFNIQNKTKFTLSVSALSLLGNGKNIDKMVGPMEKTYLPFEGQSLATPNPACAYPLLLFNCDWNPKERNIYQSGVKYLALKYSESPAWFVRLIKFEQIFDNISAPQGIPVNQLSTAIPTTQPHWLQGMPGDPMEVTMPLSISWTYKDGQVWFSIQLDENPQVVVVNESKIPLCYSDPQTIAQGHYHDFSQLPILSPYATSFFCFRQNTFPEVQSVQAELLFGLFSLPSKNVHLPTLLCEPNTIDWSPPVKCEDCDDVQLLLLGTGPKKVYLKVLAEKLGPIHYIVIEELSDAEVSARDVRARIQGEFSENHTTITIENETAVKRRHSVPIFVEHKKHIKGPTTTLSDQQLAVALVKSESALNTAKSVVSKSELETDVGTNQNPFVEVRLHFPQIQLILIDDLSGLGQRREIMSVGLYDIFFERLSKHGERPLRVLKNRQSESWLLRLLVGSVQVENALFQEKRCDFPVILQRADGYHSHSPPWSFDDSKQFTSAIETTFSNHKPVLDVGGELLITSPEGRTTLQSLEVNCEAVRVHLEDKFMTLVLPLTYDVAAVIRERLPHLQRQSQILQSQRLERHSRDSLEFILLPPEKKKTEALSDTKSAPTSGRATDFPVSSGTTIVEIFEGRRLSWSNPSTPIESPGVRSPSSGEEVRSLVAVPMETDLGLTAAPLYGDIGKDYVETIDSGQNASITATTMRESLDFEVLSERLLGTVERGKMVAMPEEVLWILEDVCNPIQLQCLRVHQLQTFLTFRGTYAGVYFAFDNSPILLNAYVANQLLTTKFNLGQTLASHFMLGAIYRAGNPMRMLASLELIGSPGSLARTLGTGVKDFVVYPLKGVREGPLAFFAGLNSGSTSLLRNFTAGTLTSVTNLAWSVSRNLDRWTLDEMEEELAEDSRRVPIDGISDGLVHGFTAFGIRLLGAIGGVLHHPLQAVIEDGASPLRIVRGFGKGLIGVVTKPVGATVELVAMTGQGLLQEAGWAQKFDRKEDVFVEETAMTLNSALKYRCKLGLTDREPGQEKLLLVIEGVEMDGRGRPTPVSLLITTDHVLVMDTSLDQVRRRESIASSIIQATDFELESSAATEFFSLLALLKQMHADDLFKLFQRPPQREVK